MLCSRSANSKINKLHEKVFRVVYKDYNSIFEELLTKDGSLTNSPKKFRYWKNKCLEFTMGFHKSLFWICFRIIIKITFVVYDLNAFKN